MNAATEPAWHVTLDVVATIATVVAAFLAAYAIWQASNARRRSIDDLVRERYIEFQLEHLSGVLEGLNAINPVQYRDSLMRPHLLVLPEELVPVTRALLDLSSTAEGESHRDAVDAKRGNNKRIVTAQHDIEAEVGRAIDALLAQRPAR